MLFLNIKKRLRNLCAPYSMQHPAKLRMVALNSTHFESPKEALAWLDQNEKSLHSTGHPGGHSVVLLHLYMVLPHLLSTVGTLPS